MKKLVDDGTKENTPAVPKDFDKTVVDGENLVKMAEENPQAKKQFSGPIKVGKTLVNKAEALKPKIKKGSIPENKALLDKFALDATKALKKSDTGESKTPK